MSVSTPSEAPQWMTEREPRRLRWMVEARMGETFLIAAGGTGGHVMPALEIARELAGRGQVGERGQEGPLAHLAGRHQLRDLQKVHLGVVDAGGRDRAVGRAQVDPHGVARLAHLPLPSHVEAELPAALGALLDRRQLERPDLGDPGVQAHLHHLTRRALEAAGVS